MNRFIYDSPQLQPGEEQISKAYNTKLYDGDHKAGFEGGDILLTTYRLLWSATSDFSSSDSLCLALPLHFVVYVEEDASSTFSFRNSNKLIIHLIPIPEGTKRPGPVEVSLHNHIKISFKNGLDNSFIFSIKESVQLRKWESRPIAATSSSLPSSRLGAKPRAGIIGIERGIQEKQKATDSSISAAFKDLTKLMEMAKDMVNIAKNVSNKIRETQGNVSEDETVQFKSYLLSLGIDDPVTRDSVATESQYIEKLAHQLVEILLQPIKEQGGMMSLADCYCRVNRARGLELLSPEDLLRAARLTNRLDLPLRLHQFESGAMVLQLSSQSDEAIVSECLQMLKVKGKLSAEELAQELGIPMQLAKERLITTEKFGEACRDESIQGLTFYPNLFLQIEN